MIGNARRRGPTWWLRSLASRARRIWLRWQGVPGPPTAFGPPGWSARALNSFGYSATVKVFPHVAKGVVVAADPRFQTRRRALSFQFFDEGQRQVGEVPATDGHGGMVLRRTYAGNSTDLTVIDGGRAS